MNYRTVNLGDGDEIQLQADLQASQVAALSPETLAVANDTNATQATYRRVNHNIPGAGNVDGVTVPDGAICLELDSGQVQYLVEV